MRLHHISPGYLQWGNEVNEWIWCKTPTESQSVHVQLSSCTILPAVCDLCIFCIRSWDVQYSCVCENKGTVKPFVAAEEAAWNLINCILWCRSVALMHCGRCRRQGFEKGRRMRGMKKVISTSVDYISKTHVTLCLHYPWCNWNTWSRLSELCTLPLHFWF